MQHGRPVCPPPPPAGPDRRRGSVVVPPGGAFSARRPHHRRGSRRPSCTTTSTAACGPATVVELAADIGHELPAPGRRGLGASGSSDVVVRFARALPRDVRAHRRRHADAATRSPGWPGSARSTSPPTAWSTPRCGTPPSSTWSAGLTLDEVVDAVQDGFDDGRAQAARRRPRRSGSAPCSPRCGTRRAARRSPSWRSGTATAGVVGFDIAGAEAGYPPSRHLDAFDYLHRENFHVTIHAGEAFGLPSIWEAVQVCGTDRLGHGVRIVDDVSCSAAGTGSGGLGAPRPAGGVGAGRAHPAGDVPVEQRADGGRGRSSPSTRSRCCKDLRFRVTVNTDNRLMSATSMSPRDDAAGRARPAGRWPTLRWVTINALKSAFIPFDERLALIEDVVKPGYGALGVPASTVRRRSGPAAPRARTRPRRRSTTPSPRPARTTG